MLSSAANIAVIGRGIAGLSAAYRLSEAGFRLKIFGRREGVAVASRCAQGVLCNKGLFFANSPLFAAKINSLSHVRDLLPKLESESGRSIPHRFQGVEEPYWSAADFQATVTRVYRHRFWGCYGTVNRSGPLADSNAERPCLGRLFYPRDGWFDVPALLNALESLLAARGTQFFDDHIESLRLHPNGGIEVQAGERRETFERVVLAAGAGLRDLYPQLGLPALKTFAIAGQTLRFHLGRRTEDHTLVKGALSFAVNAGEAVLGSSSFLEGTALEEDARELTQQAFDAFGYPLRAEDAKSLSGVRLRFADRMPIVGFAPAPWGNRLYFLAGFYKNGVHLADICAEEMLRDWQGQARLYPEFSFARFKAFQ